MIFLTVSASIICGFTGMMLPWILIMIGEPTEKKMSEAFFSAMSCRSFSMNIGFSGESVAGAVGASRPSAVR